MVLSLSECRSLADAVFRRLKLSERAPAGLYRPIDYILSLGGKRIRPTLTLMACNLFSESVEQALMPAVGLEIFHSFTLLHDDIMDRSPLRRGKATVHTLWGDNSAILSGDAMSILAYEYVSQCSPAILTEVLSVFTRTAMEVCEGQQLDMDFEAVPGTSMEEYMQMIRLKTSVLMGASLQIGALCGGASCGDALRMYRFGEAFGLAFQIQDDLLDAFGSEKVLGKPIGGDIRENKKTWLWIKAFDDADSIQRERLLQLLQFPDSERDQKFADTIRIFESLSVAEKARKQIALYFETARAALQEVEQPQERKSALLEFLDSLLYREM